MERNKNDYSYKKRTVFDGENIIDEKSILIEGERILRVGGVISTGATVINANNATLMPELIDSQVHTDIEGLHDALLFTVQLQ